MRFLDDLGQQQLAILAVTVLAVVALFTGFFDAMSLIITVGGSLTVLAATFSRDRLENAWAFVKAALAPGSDPEEIIDAVKRLARAHRLDGELGLEHAGSREADPLLRRAVQLALESRNEDELRDVLWAEARRQATEGEAARQVLVTLGKLFPAFGLIGTLIGLGMLLRHLSSLDVTTIGPGLAVAVLTTLYGAVLSNVVVLPLVTKLQAHLMREALRAEMAIEGIVLVQRKEYPTHVERVLRGWVGAPQLDETRAVRGVESHAAA